MSVSFGAAPFCAYSKISEISGLSRPPAGVKNFSPLRKNGWWLAVICTEQSHGSSKTAMNIDGVEARPQS